MQKLASQANERDYRELDYFHIGDSIGGNQEWFKEPMMKLGGCAAETACDCSIWFDMHFNRKLYPFDLEHLTRKDYRAFGTIMKPYLHPRIRGIDKLDIYTEGFGAFLRDHGVTDIQMDTLSGTAPEEVAFRRIKEQIDRNIPVPILTLKHKDPKFDDFVWHWYILSGYDDASGMVRTVTYSEELWVNFSRLWNTGFEERGGLILFRNVGNVIE